MNSRMSKLKPKLAEIIFEFHGTVEDCMIKILEGVAFLQSNYPKQIDHRVLFCEYLSNILLQIQEMATIIEYDKTGKSIKGFKTLDREYTSIVDNEDS